MRRDNYFKVVVASCENWPVALLSPAADLCKECDIILPMARRGDNRDEKDFIRNKQL